MRKFTLSIAQERGNAHNTKYPVELEISSIAQFESAMCYDNVGAIFRNHHRAIRDFQYADCILMDCDNDSIGHAEWLTPARLSERLPNVEFCIVYSKSDMQDKDKGQKGISTARPRFHVYFPLCEIVKDPERIRAMKESLLRVVPELDGGAKDAARFFYGVPQPRCEWYPGQKCLDEILSVSCEAPTLKPRTEPTRKQPRASRKERRAKSKRIPIRESIKYDIEHESYSELSDSVKLQKRMPYRPDCMTKLKGTNSPQTIRLWRTSAISNCEYVQMNPRAYYAFLVLDIDNEMSGANYLQECGLAAPYFVVFNQDNNRGHVIYALRNPVYTADFGNASALNFLQDIVKAYTEIASADKSYAGHLVKNPWSRAWRVEQPSVNVYDLSGLVTESVRGEMMKKPSKKVREGVAGLGRNCYIFENVRIWAYRAVREYWGNERNFGEWYKAVKAKCESLNAEFILPLPAYEIRSITRSIAVWVWKHITPAIFSEIQRGHIKVRWSKESRKSEGITLLKAGFTVAEVCEMLNVRHSAVYNWRSGMPEFVHERVSEVAPWMEMGISRATWYRLQSRV